VPLPVVTIRNYAHQKLFPFIVAHPYLLPLLPISVLHLQETYVSPCNQYVIKLPTTLEPLIWYDVKLQPRPDLT
jgi:hypothetical protein